MPAFRFASSNSEKATSAYQEMPGKHCCEQMLPCQLRGPIDIQGLGSVHFQIGFLLLAPKNEIGAKVHYACLELPAGQGQIAHRKGINLKSLLHVTLAVIDLMKGRRVDDDLGPVQLERSADRCRVGHLNVCVS